MAALLLGLQDGDEVIMPSYTFVSTANAFILRGAKPVFIDVRPDTLNMDEKLLEAAVTDRTRAICPVHYAGVGCEMDVILEIAKRHNLYVIEDAAHAILSTYKGRYLGTPGDFGTFSFHETKNFSSGEGGSLLINDQEFLSRAEIIRGKGTNRSQFFRGQVDKYTWVDPGSSYLPSEIIAAYLYGQLENAERINADRITLWNRYFEGLLPLQTEGIVTLPTIPADCQHNAHMFYLLTESLEQRTNLIKYLKSKDILSVFHYVPLHLSPMGRDPGYEEDALPVTENIADRIVRLPLFLPIPEETPNHIIEQVLNFYSESATRETTSIAV